MSTKNQLISVILPIHNAESLLPICLDSLKKQNYKKIEVIAIDDFSNDGSYKILIDAQKKNGKLKISQNVKKYGLSTTLNRALKQAQGRFIVFMDPKDTITKNKLFKQVEFLLKNEKVVAVGTQCIYLNEENKRIGKSEFPALHEHISQHPIHGVSVLFEGIMIDRLKIPKDLLYFPTGRKLFMYSDMAMKLIQYGELANLPEYLQFHTKSTYYSSIRSISKHIFSLITLWTIAKSRYEDMPSFRSFLSTAFRLRTSWS